MMPMMGAYGILSLGIYLLWEKTKKAVLLVREKEFQRENVEAVLKSMQHLTGIMAEHIASHNSEIMSWVELRKKQGRLVSQKVESSNKKIAIALQSLSEMSFVYPYTENRPRNLYDFEKELQNKLSDV
jgi:predicted amino acid dehydrogenase